MRGLTPPFAPCQFCDHIKERDPKHVVREIKHAIVIPGDDEHDECYAGACDEHYEDYRRVRPIGADMEDVHAAH